jgi:glycosyltransferase involved in cell wall biosynthesis
MRGVRAIKKLAMNLSIVIPAHNEEQFIESCIKSIYENCKLSRIDPEVIVVLNRCTDRTKEIVDGLGAKYVDDHSRNLAKIRNTGIKNAEGDIIITIDADSIITKEYISDLMKNITSRKFIGGGTRVDFSRKSLGIIATKMMLDLYVKLSGLSCGAFWFYRKYYDEIGGFDEKLHFGEDIHFAKRLRDFGKSINLKYGISGKIITSSRKFDKYGDWYFFKLILFKQKAIKGSVTGKDLSFVNEYFYDFNKNDKKSTTTARDGGLLKD